MLESERTVHETAVQGEPRDRGVCSQLLADRARYVVWHSRHESRMETVAERGRRELQILALRGICVERLHRAALVRYFRDYRVTGPERDQTLREFYGVLEPRDAAVMEHRNYLVAASTQLCATELLELAGDHQGVELVRSYESAYMQYFSLFCERARALQNRETFLLGALLPEVHGAAERLRLRIVSGHLMPSGKHGRVRPAA
jgi:hypothetical protein